MKSRRGLLEQITHGNELDYANALHALGDGDLAALTAAADSVGVVADGPTGRMDEMVRAALAGLAKRPLSEPLARFLVNAASVSPSCVEEILKEVASAALKAESAAGLVALAEHVCDIYPAASRMWAVANTRAFPHHRRDASDIQLAVRAVLLAFKLTRFDEVRRALMSLLWDRLVTMDVELETTPTTFFAMDGDDRLADPMRPKVDAYVFEMIQSPPDDENTRFHWIQGFEKEVLRVKACRIAPYPLLYVCAVDEVTFRATLRRFWTVFADGHRQWVVRHQSVVYAASLLTAVPCRPNIIIDWLTSAMHWIHVFCDSIDLDADWHPSLSWAILAVAKVLATHSRNLVQLGHADRLRSMRLSRIPFLKVLTNDQAVGFKESITQTTLLDPSAFRPHEGVYDSQTNRIEWTGYFESDCVLPISDKILSSALRPAVPADDNRSEPEADAPCVSSFQASVPSSFEIDQDPTAMKRVLTTVPAV